MPQIHLGDTHISVNNPQNDPKTIRTDSPQLVIEKRPYQKNKNQKRVEIQLGTKATHEMSIGWKNTTSIEKGKEQTPQQATQA